MFRANKAEGSTLSAIFLIRGHSRKRSCENTLFVQIMSLLLKVCCELFKSNTVTHSFFYHTLKCGFSNKTTPQIADFRKTTLKKPLLKSSPVSNCSDWVISIRESDNKKPRKPLLKSWISEKTQLKNHSSSEH